MWRVSVEFFTLGAKSNRDKWMKVECRLTFVSSIVKVLMKDSPHTHLLLVLIFLVASKWTFYGIFTTQGRISISKLNGFPGI